MIEEAKDSKKLDTTSNTAKRIQRVFNTLTPQADLLNKTPTAFEWQLAILKADDVNAYVAAGGKLWSIQVLLIS